MEIEFSHSVYDEGAVWQEESWTAHSAQEVPWHMPMEVSTCVYFNGRHVSAGPDCPHDVYNRDNPLDLEPGWTVLNIPRGN